MEVHVRQSIGAMKISLDEKVAPPEGPADWVDGWSDDYNLIPQIDACLLGAGMYSGYEQYWTAIQNDPKNPNPMTGKVPTPAEVEWARFARRHRTMCSRASSRPQPGQRRRSIRMAIESPCDRRERPTSSQSQGR